VLRLFRLAGLAVGIACGLAGLLVLTSRRFGAVVAADRRRLLDAPRPPHPPLVTEEMLAGLPEPAQRYLRYAGVVGKPLVDTVRLRQRLRMRVAPDAPSLPMVAEQWYTVDPPGFIWDATVPVEGLPLVRGRDGYVEGRGLMTIRLGSVAPVVDAAGPEMDQASLVRHLSEMPWFPSAFLRESVTWEAIDDSNVRVTLAHGDRRATGVLEIDAEGGLIAFRAERYAMVGKGFELRPWTAPTYAYGEFEGLRLPVRGAAVWTLPDGTELEYITVELTEVEYDPPLPA
jgi:hypothetical protein